MVIAAVSVSLSPSVGQAHPDKHTLTCGPEQTIGRAIKRLKPGDTLVVSGTCDENVDIGQEVARITLDGQGTASINAAPTAFGVTVRGRGITIRGFTITGGAQGIAVLDGGAAVIDGNTIQGAVMNGITVFRDSTANIMNNTIQQQRQQRDPIAAQLERSDRVLRSSHQQDVGAQHDPGQWRAGDPGVQRFRRPDLLEYHPEQRQPWGRRGSKRPGRDRRLQHHRQLRQRRAGDEEFRRRLRDR